MAKYGQGRNGSIQGLRLFQNGTSVHSVVPVRLQQLFPDRVMVIGIKAEWLLVGRETIAHVTCFFQDI